MHNMRAPSRTVTTGGAAGAVAIVLLWLLGELFPQLTVPTEVESALTLLIAVAAAWIIPDPGRRPDVSGGPRH